MKIFLSMMMTLFNADENGLELGRKLKSIDESIKEYFFFSLCRIDCNI